MEYPQQITSEHVQDVFRDAADLVIRPLQIRQVCVTAFFIDGLTSGSEIADFVLHPVSQCLCGTGEEMLEQCLNGTIYSAVAKEVRDMKELCRLLVNGFCVLVFENVERAVAFEAKTGEKRSPSPPDVENTVKGAKDAFTETVRTNTSLLRRHLRSPWLRLYETQVGSQSMTNVTVAWIEGVTDPQLVKRMKDRLCQIEIDGMLTPAAVEETVTGNRTTAFPLLRFTERTDRFARGLLEGSVGLLVDGLPVGYLTPVELAEFLSSPEDQGMDFVSASAVRILRYAALLVSLLLPAAYGAMAVFHQEMIPAKLLSAIIESKAQVPFPTMWEILGLLIAFEILQEAGIHLPQSLGQTVSIIGGLVVGSAAVEAKLISPAALIVVSVAGICGYAIPGRELADSIRIWRFVLALCAALAGLFAVSIGLVVLLLHLGGLQSFGRNYLSPFDRAGTGGVVLRHRIRGRKGTDTKTMAEGE